MVGTDTLERFFMRSLNPCLMSIYSVPAVCSMGPSRGGGIKISAVTTFAFWCRDLGIETDT